MRRRRIGDRFAPAILLLIAGLLVTLAGCRPDGRSGPERSVLDLFELARVEEPSGEQLSETFAEVPALGAARAALLDALDGLAGVTDPEIAAVDRSAGPRDAFVDVAVKLPGGGSARISARLESGDDGVWRVRWFQGPGVEWPTPRTRRGEGLTSSAPPDT